MTSPEVLEIRRLHEVCRTYNVEIAAKNATIDSLVEHNHKLTAENKKLREDFTAIRHNLQLLAENCIKREEGVI